MFRALLDAIPHVTWLHGEDLARVVHVNAAFERVFARPRASLDGAPLSWLDVVHPDDRPRVRAAMEARAGGDATAPLADFRVVRPDGEIRWLRSSLERADEGPAGVFWVETMLDVTSDRVDMTAARETERALRESEKRLRRMSESMRDVFYLVSLDAARIEYANAAFERVWGIPREAVYADPGLFFAGIHPEDLPAVMQAVEAHTSGACDEVDLDYRVVRPDGSIRWLTSRCATAPDDEGGPRRAVGLATDITDRKLAERALHESEERFRRMSEGMRDVFFLASRDRSRFYYLNPAFERVFGVPREAVLADPALSTDLVHPEDRPGLVRDIAAHAGGAADELDAEVRIVRPDGEIRWISVRTYPVEDDEAGVPRVVGVAADITDRKEAERVLRERTAELERLLREKDVLLAEVHHRVKNNLQSISSLMHMLAARADRRPIHETIEELEQRIQTMALVHETLYRSSDLAAVGMQSYLDRIILGVPGRSHRAVTIDVGVRASGMTLDLDAALRCGLIVNELVQNALKHAFARRKRGRIDVLLERAGDRLLLRVADDGNGLPADVDFDSDATLGLRLVRGLAEQLGGTARRAPDARSAIEIEFPANR